jgi:hypothetical protein
MFPSLMLTFWALQARQIEEREQVNAFMFGLEHESQGQRVMPSSRKGKDSANP